MTIAMRFFHEFDKTGLQWQYMSREQMCFKNLQFIFAKFARLRTWVSSRLEPGTSGLADLRP